MKKYTIKINISMKIIYMMIYYIYKSDLIVTYYKVIIVEICLEI